MDDSPPLRRPSSASTIPVSQPISTGKLVSVPRDNPLPPLPEAPVNRQDLVVNPRIESVGVGTELFLIVLANTALKVLTLGIYHFWGKVRVRKYLWSTTRVSGEPLEYSGTGLELLKSFLLILPLYLIVFGVFFADGLLEGTEWKAVSSAAVLFLVLGWVTCFLPMARFAGMRGLLARTRLRGIKAGLEGSAVRYGLYALGLSIISMMTLGLYSPFRAERLRHRMLNGLRLGSQRIQYFGDGQPLFGPHLVSLILTVPTLGIVWFWYRVQELRHAAARLHVGPLTFRFTGSSLSYAGLRIGIFFLSALTFGLARPFTRLALLRWHLDNLEIYGDLNYAALSQSHLPDSGIREGMLELFDEALV